jgi:hypothetical protein
MRVALRKPLASDGADYRHSLTTGSEYVVIGLSADHFRLVNDHGEPVLYESECFEVTDATESAFWLSRVDDGDRYANPPGWGVPGFYEAWHDRVEVVRRVFAEQLAFWYPEVAGVRKRSPQRTQPDPAD